MEDDTDCGAYCDKDKAHPRAVALMVEDFFWDPVSDDTPFGSDEGYESYFSWREWRSSSPDADLKDAMRWILEGRPDPYLALSNTGDPQEAFNDSSYSMAWDFWTLNITVIATALSQLLDEGTIDEAAKPFVFAATSYERSPRIDNPGFMSVEVLDAIDRVVTAA